MFPLAALFKCIEPGELAAITALTIATIPPILRGIWRRLTRAKVVFDVKSWREHSSPIDGFYYLRIPVVNEGHHRDACNIEVLLTKVSGDFYRAIPMRLHFAHKPETTALRVPHQTPRLVDVLRIRIPRGEQGYYMELMSEAGQAAKEGVLRERLELELKLSWDEAKTQSIRIEVKVSPHPNRPIMVEPLQAT